MFRYYDPDSGRFTQQDPIGRAGSTFTSIRRTRWVG
nr:hypothetical protein [Pantoea agglomerans]